MSSPLEEFEDALDDLRRSGRTVRFLIEYKNLGRPVPIVGTLVKLDDERGVLTIRKRGDLGDSVIYLHQIRNWEWKELDAEAQ